MKNFKRLTTLLLTIAMMLVMTVSTFAQTVDVESGDGSITITNAAQGKDYSIYKLFDATVSDDGISYKVPEGKTIADDNAWFTVDSAGNVLAKEGADITTDAFKTWAQSFGTQVGNTVTAADNTVKFDNIPYGYYYVESSLGSIITVDSTMPDVEVIDKNETEPVIPDEFKTVGDETAQLGDDVDFTINFTATNYVTKNKVTTQVTEYTIEDDPTALDIDADSIKITIDDDVLYDATAETPVTNENISVSVSDAGKMTIVLTWADEDGKTIYDYSVPVKVEYTATVTNAGADTAGIKNSATISYNDTEETTEVEVDTYQITLNKVDAEGNALTGAEFEIRRNSEDSDALALVDLGGGTYRIATEDDTTTTTVIAAGTAIIKGLDGADTYYLKETTAPEGYNILTEQEEVEMGNNDQEVNVTNQAGAELPSTGGIGTTMFYVAGTLMVLVAGVYMVSKRRMDA